MRATYGLACALTAGLAAGSAQATFIHFDINTISVFAGESFDGETHSGTLELSANAESSLSAIELDGSNQALTADLGTLDGEIVILNGSVVGGFISFTASDGSEYLATIGSEAGAVNAQAGRGFRVDGLTYDGAFDELVGGTSFAGVDVMSKLGDADPNLFLGSFLLHGYGPDESGFDGMVDLDVYADVVIPAPGPAALAVCGVLAGVRRRR